jgi:predicted metalloendopeptidase
MRASRRLWLVAAAALALLSPVSASAQLAKLLPDSMRPLRVVDTAWIDKNVSACTDFFQYANGAWLAQDTIPATRRRASPAT